MVINFSIRFLFLAFCTTLISTFTLGQEWQTESSGKYTYKYVTNDPTHTRFYTLKNGLTVILSQNTEKPRIQTYIAVKAGSKTDPATHTGLAHYLEHMLFKGTDQFGSLNYKKEKPILDQIDSLYEIYNSTSDEVKRKYIYHLIDSTSGVAAQYAIANEYDKMMSDMGAEKTNAFTSFEETVYTDDIPGNTIDKYLTVQAERFRNPVFRIFHTELEAVYEEKNISLDNDFRRAFEKFFQLMFENHNYGKQTTIGTIEHLKNPSLVEIRKYFDAYYVPNNMGIIMVGDLDYEEVIEKIDKHFAYMQPKEVTPYKFQPETEIKAPIKGEVTGPNPESVLIGFRFPGATTKDARMLNLMGQILTNGSAGLLDLNLIQQQKLLAAYAFPYILKDYSMLILQGNPKSGQSLEEVQKLILSQLEKLKKGEFDDQLIASIINNEIKNQTMMYEDYDATATLLMSNFTSETDWKHQVGYISDLKSITKADIIKFANKYLGNNYVVVYKKQGENEQLVKVEKPTINPVEVNRDAQSDFLKKVNAMPESNIAPKWIDFQRDIQRSKSNGYEILAVQNKQNDLFKLYYYYNTGKWANKLLPIAADFINYVGTDKKSAEQVSKEFYALASSFRIVVNDEETYVILDGLDNNMQKTIRLFDDLLLQVQANPAVLESYKDRLRKARKNAKEDKRTIMRGLTNYAKYGADNPFNFVLSDQELDNLTVAQLIQELKNLTRYPHQILYYGPLTVNEAAQKISQEHKNPKASLELPTPKNFTEQTIPANNVLFAHYDMVQAEVSWIRSGSLYNPEMEPVNSLFNQYFGGGMGSIVFQTLRESKALAYSTFSYISNPVDLKRRETVMAYIGTQSDKLQDALKGMNELLNELPQSDKAFSIAQTSILKSLVTSRVTKDDIMLKYLDAKKQGIDYDMRKVIYNSVPSITFGQLTSYHNRLMDNKPYTYCVVADKSRISEEELSKIGKVKHLSLEEIFGY